MMYTKLSLVAKGSTVQKAVKQSHFNYISPHCNLDFEDDNCLFHMTLWLTMMPSLVTKGSAAQEISSGQTIETLFKHLLSSNPIFTKHPWLPFQVSTISSQYPYKYTHKSELSVREALYLEDPGIVTRHQVDGDDRHGDDHLALGVLAKGDGTTVA